MIRDARRQQIDVVIQHATVPLSFSVWGKGQPAWIFIHGMGSSRWAFADLLEKLAVKGAYYAVDLPGFGDSGLPPKRQQLTDYVDALRQFIDQMQLHLPILVGHSFGGMVAAETTAQLGDQINGCILVSSAGFIPPRNVMTPGTIEWLNRLAIWVMGMDVFGQRMVQSLGMDARYLTPSMRERMRYGWRRSREMARMGAFYRSDQLVERLAQTDVPTIFIHGDRDPLFPLPRMQEKVGSNFPVLIMPGAGHLPYDQDIEMFLSLFEQAVAHLQSRRDIFSSQSGKR
ncbi:MAG: alpha/beta hydrolase [Firmicutes bacterium]|nr:alpha/beta hydrolase [Bacillota bacterium]